MCTHGLLARQTSPAPKRSASPRSRRLDPVRYPHRNKYFGRETTQEEAEWLAGPDVPRWAK
jgi:hypothetical protein